MGVSNHGSFYFAQSAALNMLGGDKDRSIANLRYYFSHQFLDQLAASGEQPFEAVRTRPFHYRCFNLEAMIVCASPFLGIIPESEPSYRPMRSSATNSGLTSGWPNQNMVLRFKMLSISQWRLTQRMKILQSFSRTSLP